MKVSELKQFLANRPDDQEIKVKYVIIYKDKDNGISLDFRGDETRCLWLTHCVDDECILIFQPRLKYRDKL